MNRMHARVVPPIDESDKRLTACGAATLDKANHTTDLTAVTCKRCLRSTRIGEQKFEREATP